MKREAVKRKKPDKTVDDFIEEAEKGNVAKDANWKDFATQQDDLRRNELAVQAFWANHWRRSI